MGSSSVVADSDPLSITALPSASNASSTSTQEPAPRIKTVKRTYGKRAAVAQDSEMADVGRSLVLNDASTNRVGKENATPATKHKSLLFIPESELDQISGMDASSSSGEEEVMNKKRADASSPTARPVHHSTDPTSEEEEEDENGEADKTLQAESRSRNVLMTSSSPAASDGEDDDDPMAAFLRAGKGVKNKLAEMDDDDFDFDAVERAEDKHQSTSLAVAPAVFSTQSDLTSLPTSDDPTTTRSSQPSHLAAQTSQGEATMQDGDDEEDEEAITTNRNKTKSQRRIIDSDEDEDDEPIAAAKPRPAVIASSSLDEIEDADVELSNTQKGPKTKAPSKKELEMMHSETAKIQRAQDFRLAPRVKQPMIKIGDLINKHQRDPPLAPTRKQLTFATKSAKPESTTTTSDSIEPPTDSPIKDSTPISEKAMGKRRENEHLDATPTVNRQRVIPRPIGAGSKPISSTTGGMIDSDDEEEELLPLDKVLAKRAQQEADRKSKLEKEEQNRKWLEQKRAIAKANENKTLAEDPESSDFEIEIAPAKRSDCHATSATATRAGSEGVSRSARQIRSLDVDVPPAQRNHESDEKMNEDIALLMRGRGKKPKGWVPKASVDMPSKASKKTENGFGSIDELNDILRAKLADKNIMERTRKQREARRKQDEDRQAPGAANGENVAKVDVQTLLKTKDERIKAARQEEEDEEDAQDGDWEEDDAGSDDEEEAYDSGNEMVEQEAEDEEGSGADEIDSNDQELVEDVDDEELLPVLPKRKVRILASSDEEDDDIDGKSLELVKPLQDETGRVQLPSFLDSQPDRGFSQFFGDDISQAFGASNEKEGFQRRATQKFAIDETASQEDARENALLLSKTQRLADNQALAERAAIQVGEPPETPGQGYDAPPRVYINKQGLMTQTRPLNLFGAPSLESPGGSEYSALDSASRSRTMELDSSSQRPTGLTQTQIASNHTPTQASKGLNRLHRAGALIAYDSFNDLPATEIEPASTVMDEMEETQETDLGESLPSAAQTTSTRNAFDVMRTAIQQSTLPGLAEEMTRETKRKAYSAFIEREADLSDEEDGGLGRLSGDEDETNLDDELESLVDHEEVDRDLADEQDALVDELYAEDMAKKDAEQLARAQRIVDGKERQGRKGLDIDDDDFDDDYGISKGRAEKRQRVENLTTAQLQANEETRQFAMHITEGLMTTVREADVNYLADANSDNEQNSDFDDGDETQDRDGDVLMSTPDDDEDSMPPPRSKISMREANRLAIEASRRQAEEKSRSETYEKSPELEVRLGTGDSSSPAPLIRVKNRTTMSNLVIPKPRLSEDFENLDSQYKMGHAAPSRVQYKASLDSREDSQGSTSNGTTAGSKSAVTSFKKVSSLKVESKKLDSGVTVTSRGGKALIGRKSTMAFRSNNFD